MMYLRSLFLCAALTAISVPAAAQPSFRCDGRLNTTEAAICATPTLGRLDVEMVALFRDRFRALAGNAQSRLRDQQRAWLSWRNACGQDRRCVMRRYQERIAEFRGSAATSSPGPAAGPDDVVETRIKDGRFETLYGDGRIEWSDATGGSFGTIFPDGTQNSVSAIQIPGDPIPPLPNNLSQWGGFLETNLLSVIDGYLKPEDRTPYRDIYAHEPFGERMLSHIGAIQHLSQE